MLTYGSKTWALRKIDKKRVKAAKMRFMRLTAGVTLRDGVRSEDVRNNLKSNAGDEANQKLQKKVEGTRREKLQGPIRVTRGKYINGDRPLGLFAKRKRR